MIKVVCSVYDEVAQEFGSVVVEDNSAQAKRSFESAVWKAQVDEEGLFWSNPRDFSLYYIGDFDSETGVLAPVSPIVRLVNAGDSVFEYNRWKESEV